MKIADIKARTVCGDVLVIVFELMFFQYAIQKCRNLDSDYYTKWLHSLILDHAVNMQEICTRLSLSRVVLCFDTEMHVGFSCIIRG